MTEENAHLSITETDTVSIVQFADRKIIEELSISEIQNRLTEFVGGKSGIKLLLSFKNVEHLSSAALGMLITLNKKIEEQAGELRLSDITPQIFEVFKITRLNKLFSIYDSEEEALRSF